MQTISRKEAKEKGLKFYYTGFPCKAGHISKRQTINATCYMCSLEKTRARTNTPQGNLKQREYRKANKDKVKVWKAKDWKLNGHKRVEYNRAYARKYNLENRGMLNNKSAKYRAKKLKASPVWANQQLILDIYKNRPKGMCVDHIIPLQGSLVSGLHVEYNLQYISFAANKSKSNLFTPYREKNGKKYRV